jgi:hypothetical protein
LAVAKGLQCSMLKEFCCRTAPDEWENIRILEVSTVAKTLWFNNNKVLWGYISTQKVKTQPRNRFT